MEVMICLQYIQKIKTPDIWFCWKVYRITITRSAPAYKANKARDGGVVKLTLGEDDFTIIKSKIYLI